MNALIMEEIRKEFEKQLTEITGSSSVSVVVEEKGNFVIDVAWEIEHEGQALKDSCRISRRNMVTVDDIPTVVRLSLLCLRLKPGE